MYSRIVVHTYIPVLHNNYFFYPFWLYQPFVEWCVSAVLELMRGVLDYYHRFNISIYCDYKLLIFVVFTYWYIAGCTLRVCGNLSRH